MVCGVILFVVIACVLIRLINRSAIKKVVFKDRSVVNAGCIGGELCDKYASFLSENELKCVVLQDISEAAEKTHLVFLYDSDDENMAAISKCREINEDAKLYALLNDPDNRGAYENSGALLIENGKDVESVMFNIIEGLEEVSDK